MNRRDRQRRRRRHRGHPLRRGLLVGVLVCVGTLGLAGLAAVGWVVSVAESAPSIDSLRPRNEGAVSSVYAANGQRLGFIQSDTLRVPVTDQQIPELMRDATVAIEDRRYYKHGGVDLAGIARAALKNLTSNGRQIQGGSTLTMQLIKNIYLPDNSKRTIKTKIIEAKLAEELEKKHSKRWILDHYLNDVAYGTVGGQTAVGVGAAARMFFDTTPDKLSLAQAALLAGLPQAPSDYNPFLNPSGALGRRNEVLRAMIKYVRPDGTPAITAAEAQEAMREPLGVKHNTYFHRLREGYFFDYVKDQLIKRYGLRVVRQGGLKIHTTIDLYKQKIARAAIAHQLYEPSDPAAALVTIDQHNGHILAMASSESYGKTKFNYAAQAHRQPGSTFKIMVLMAALRKGIQPESTYYTSHALAPGWLPGYPDYGVTTFGHEELGSINLVNALVHSDNTVFAQLDADVTPEAVTQAARDMGITSPLYNYPAEGLGGLKYGVSPLEMAAAYSTIANGGWRIRPTAITKVEFPDGHVDNLGDPPRVKEFPTSMTDEATRIMHDNALYGTGVNANLGCWTAGKTGTTEDFKDAWFVGFTPRMTTASWVGYPNPPIPMYSVHGIEVQGAAFPSYIWHEYMSTAIGAHCDDYVYKGGPFEGTPFFGHYATTGSSSDHNYSYGGGSSGTGGSSSGTSGTGGSSPYNNPHLYENPPQTAPASPSPAPAPSPAPSPTPPPPPPQNGSGGAGAPPGR